MLEKIFDELFPIMRSITGFGIEKTIEICKRHIPLKKDKIPTGTKVFDWIIPPEWYYYGAKLMDPEGNVICDADINNLHLVNYSQPVDGCFALEDLKLHSIPELPNAIPYITSYYKTDWGFCLTHNQRQQLKKGFYHVKIDTEFVNGGIPIAQAKLEGDMEDEILLTSYICHPSLANNELSGILAIISLYDKIRKWKKRRYTYRFLLNPETIGALCFLYKYGKDLKLVSGMVLTCLGGDAKTMKFKQSRCNSLINKVVEYDIKTLLPIEILPFDPTSGSDERQYCSPGFNLPMGQISRTTYMQYEGYHNSLDNKEFMNIDSVKESIETIEQILKYMEICGYPINTQPFGEPQLGKRGLYPNMNSAQTRENSEDNYIDGRTQLNRILTILNMADGKNTLMDIANKLGVNVLDLKEIIEKLEKKGLVRYENIIF